MSASVNTWRQEDQQGGLFDALSSSDDEEDLRAFASPEQEQEPEQEPERRGSVAAAAAAAAQPEYDWQRWPEQEESDEAAVPAQPYPAHAAVTPRTQRSAKAAAEAKDTAAQLRRRLRSEKELRARAEERLAAASRSVEGLTASLSEAKKRAKKAAGARSGVSSPALLLAEASAGKLRAEAEALRLKLVQAEASGAKQQKARKVAEAKISQLAEAKTVLLRETGRLAADLEAAQLDATASESVRVVMNDKLAHQQRGAASREARQERALAVSNRRVSAARLASFRTTFALWGQFTRQSSWIKRKATESMYTSNASLGVIHFGEAGARAGAGAAGVITSNVSDRWLVLTVSEQLASAMAEVSREKEAELEDTLGQISSQHEDELAALRSAQERERAELATRLDVSEEANERSQAEILSLSKQLADESANSRHAELLASRVSDEVSALREMVVKAEGWKRELRLSEAGREAAEAQVKAWQLKAAEVEEERE